MPSIWDKVKEKSTLVTGTFWEHMCSAEPPVTLMDGIALEITDTSTLLAVQSDSLNMSLSEIQPIESKVPIDNVSLQLDSLTNYLTIFDDIALSIGFPEGNIICEEGEIMEKITAEAVGGHRIITVDDLGHILHASSSLIEDGKQVMGMTLHAASAGSICQIAISGDEVTEPSWSWIPSEPLYLGEDGIITQIPPTSGFILIIGVALTPTSIRVRIEMPIFL